MNVVNNRVDHTGVTCKIIEANVKVRFYLIPRE
jgi:hypothetical protein